MSISPHTDNATALGPDLGSRPRDPHVRGPIAHTYARIIWADRRAREVQWLLVIPVCPICGKPHQHGGGGADLNKGGSFALPDDGHRYSHCLGDKYCGDYTLVVDLHPPKKVLRAVPEELRYYQLFGFPDNIRSATPLVEDK